MQPFPPPQHFFFFAKKQATPIPPPEKNKVTLVIYFCEKTLPLFGKKGLKKHATPPSLP